MGRWQKPYLDVPADDYTTSEEYTKRCGFPLNYIPRLNDLIGPHENRYINLMKLGRKPISWIEHWELQYWNKHISENNWNLRIYIHSLDGFYQTAAITYFVYLQNQEWRVNRFIRAFEYFQRSVNSDVNEVRMGFLLGYTKRCIATFLERSRLIDEGASSEVYNAPHLIKITEEKQ